MPFVRTPLYADPLYNGAADPMIIKNEQNGKFYMFYTQRRASAAVPGSVSYCYGSDIGIAQADCGGAYWYYRGALKLDFEFGKNTFWAPEVIFDSASGKYHMFVSYIRGVHSEWKGKSVILHYTSLNLFDWDYIGKADVSEYSVIDPCILKLKNGTYRMWFKEESDKAHTAYADSEDLIKWKRKGLATFDCPQEGPNVFEFGGNYWLVADEWKGLSVYKSDDAENFKRQAGKRLLEENGSRYLDRGVGKHADVFINNAKAYIVYFVHYNDNGIIESKDNHPTTVIQLAELKIKNGLLTCSRNDDIDINLI